MGGETDQARVGRCWDCRWVRRVVTGRGSLFFRCGRAEIDPAYPRYPSLPRLACPGYEPPTSGSVHVDAPADARAPRES